MSEDVMSNADRLVYMANQIARNFATLGEARSAELTAEHISQFWDPRMRRRAFAMLADPERRFEPAARLALDGLMRREAVRSQ